MPEDMGDKRDDAAFPLIKIEPWNIAKNDNLNELLHYPQIPELRKASEGYV